jgi:hypothetical protein
MGRTMDGRLSTTPDNEHEWFRRHLPDHLLELLVEDDRKRFEAHARRCATCARVLTSALGARADWWDGAGHPPVGLLLDWNASEREDRTHEAVRSHLAACEECRRDLGDLRGEAMLSQVALAPVALRTPRPRDRVSFPWGGLAAAAATLVAVAAILTVWPRGERPAPVPPPAQAPATTAAPAMPEPFAAPATPAAPEPAPGRAAEPVTLVSTDRGGERGATEIVLEPGVVRVPLTLPMLSAPDDSMLEVELRDAADALVSRQLLAAGRALRPGGVELAAEGLAAGRYRLTVRWIDPVAGETSRVFALDVRLSR